MALAKAGEMAAIARPNGRFRPAATIKAPQIRKAPTAEEKPPLTAPVVASKAAPGVDQAPDVGMRDHRLSTMPTRPIAMASAISPEAASASVAPTAVSPLRMTAKELA